MARLVPRPCRRRRPSSLDDGGISGLFSSGGPSVRSLTRYDGEVIEPLVGRQVSRGSMRVARGSASLLPSHGRGIWPRDVLMKFSRGLSRVGEAGEGGRGERPHWGRCERQDEARCICGFPLSCLLEEVRWVRWEVIWGDREAVGCGVTGGTWSLCF